MAQLRPGLVAAVLVLTAAGLTSAQSPSQSGRPSEAPSTSPAASATGADCTSAAALLPPSVDDLALDVTTTSGVAAIDPDELLDPLLASLGRGRADACVVAFRYGDAPDGLAGQLLRVAGVAVPDLAARFVAALRDQLVTYGADASPQAVESDGRTVWTLDITAADTPSRIVASQLDDMVLLTTDLPALERLMPLLVKASTPEP